MVSLNYSTIYPLSGGGGSANIAGFEWAEKTADFTAEANKAYYCDTALGDVLMTLPPSPAPGDEVAFLIIGSGKVNITTTDKIKGAALATDFVKQVSQQYLMFVFFYVDSATGWNWDARYDSYISNFYTGTGFTHWRFSWSGMLAEIQANWGTGTKTLTVANGVTSFTAVSGFVNQTPSFAALSNGTINSAGEYIGRTPDAIRAIAQAVFPFPVMIQSLSITPQSATNAIYNVPSVMDILKSFDGVSFTNHTTITFGSSGSTINSPYANTSLRPFTLTTYPI